MNLDQFMAEETLRWLETRARRERSKTLTLTKPELIAFRIVKLQAELTRLPDPSV